MKVTHYYGCNSQAAATMRYDLMHGAPSLYDKYVTPSCAKVCSFNAIRANYNHNETQMLGIPCKEVVVPSSMKKLNNKMYARYISGTLVVASATCHVYTTCAIFEDVETNKRYIIKETHCNTYMCDLYESEV